MKLTNLVKVFFATCVVLLVSACGGSDDNSEPPVASKPLRVVAFGDSLTEGLYFVTPSNLWVQHIQRQLTADGIEATVINEGKGGETSGQALSRLPEVLARTQPTHIILSHGTNDIDWYCPGCYDLPERNLIEMIRIARNAGVQVILAEFNYRARTLEESENYAALYQRVVKSTNVAYANMTENVTFDQVNYHPDLVHFTDAPQSVMANAVISVLYGLIN